MHCSASDRPEDDAIEVIRRWHLERGFSEVGYHYFIRKNGLLEPGRSLERIPAAQKGHNRNTIAICLHGLHKERFTEEQFDALRDVALGIHDAYDGEISFHGHCEVSPKACPVFDYREVLALDRFGTLGLSGVQSGKQYPSVEEEPRLSLGSRGPAVEHLQELLFVRVDGIYGPRTERALKRFCLAEGLPVGVGVEPAHWRRLLGRVALRDGAV